MQIAPPDPSTPIWHYVAYVAGTIVLALLIPAVRQRAVALVRRAPRPPENPQG